MKIFRHMFSSLYHLFLLLATSSWKKLMALGSLVRNSSNTSRYSFIQPICHMFILLSFP